VSEVKLFLTVPLPPLSLSLLYINNGSYDVFYRYNGAFFLGDYSFGWIKYLKFNNAGTKVTSDNMFDNNVGTIISFEQAPNGDFFFTTLWAVYAVRYSGGNSPPLINSFTSSDLTAGNAPHTVEFQVSASDPDGDSLSYLWKFGDGSTSTQKNPSKTYTSIGTFPVTVTVGVWLLNKLFSKDLDGLTQTSNTGHRWLDPNVVRHLASRGGQAS
jgi:hypothetical protein